MTNDEIESYLMTGRLQVLAHEACQLYSEVLATKAGYEGTTQRDKDNWLSRQSAHLEWSYSAYRQRAIKFIPDLVAILRERLFPNGTGDFRESVGYLLRIRDILNGFVAVSSPKQAA